ncbi:MAG: Hsp70 family protein [Kineothrix sp.]
MAVIGIDLGTTNSLMAWWKDGEAAMIPNSLGSWLTPSVVSVMGEEVLVGEAAKERLLTCKDATAAAFKRFMGTRKKYELDGREFTPVELSALVLRKLKQDAEACLGEEIREAVISVPAYFNDRQRRDTRLAAQLAGLKTERLINEPSAAALAYQMQQGEGEACLLVFDFGGGTLDISLVEYFDNVIEIEAVAGDNHLGGNDVDRLLYGDFIHRHEELAGLDEEGTAGLKKALTEAKCLLGAKEKQDFTYTYGDLTVEDEITQEQLLTLGLPMLERIRRLFSKVLQDGQYRAEDVGDVIMVGGSSQLYFVQRFVEELFQKPPVIMESPELAVAKGMGCYAGIRMRDAHIRDRMMTDVCPFTLGTDVVWGRKDERAHMCPVLERNCPLPSSKTVRLYTTSGNQTFMRVGIYQGEEYYVDENLWLGELVINVRERPAGEESIAVTFSYDINGILQVEAVNAMNQKVTRLIANDALNEKEIEDSLRRLEEMRLHEEEEYQLLLARLSWLYVQQSGERREYTGRVIHSLEQARAQGRHRAYRKAEERAQAWLVQASAAMDVFGPAFMESMGEVMEEEYEEEWDGQ